jgi:drug/metabolite transporter (DMT)-like permease
LVTIAEDLGVGSGIAATAAASIPLWTAVFAGLSGHWPCRTEWTGIAVGFAGVGVLSLEGDIRTSALGALLIIVAPIFWSFGSVLSKRLELPGTWMATSGQLLAGGLTLLVLGPLRGERIAALPTAGSIAALVYLTVIGSIVAFSAYVYLLRELKPTAATSYAYVNPVVAVVLGVTIGGEVLTGPALVALPLILAGVGLIGLAQRGGVHTERVPAPVAERA